MSLELRDRSSTQPVPTLETRKVSRILGEGVKTQVLHEIDLTIRSGEFAALTGHSGSGKSTLLYVLGVLDRPTTGEVFIEGRDASRLSDDERAALRNEKLGFVFQFHFLLPELTVLENVQVPMLRRGVPVTTAREKANAMLDELKLGALTKRRPSQLSGGQQQRVSIARALANEPRILLADEPTGNLDSESGETVMQLFERFNRERALTIVMVTHDPSFAERATRRLVMADGRIVREA